MGNRAAVLFGPGDLRVQERPVPAPGPREVLVESCRECRAGRYNLCRDVRFFATPPVDGAFAQYVAIHEDFAFALPDHVSDEAGALMEPLSVAVWACRKAGVGAGDRVLITGAGTIGLLTVQAARAFGATGMTITDVNPHRLALAERTGATATLDVRDTPLEDAGEHDALIECSGRPEALAAGIAALRPAGTAVVVGMGPDEEAVVPLALIQNRELWLTGTFRYAGTYPAAIALAAAGRVDLEAIVTGRFGLEETEAALRAGREDPASVKAIVRP
jgi:L-iditol 2-dehydrogenase